MASAFSICALVENWKVIVPPGGNEAHGIDVKDPQWYKSPVSFGQTILTREPIPTITLTSIQWENHRYQGSYLRKVPLKLPEHSNEVERVSA